MDPYIMRDGKKMNEGYDLKIIANRWKLLEKIGHGGFGEIHKGILNHYLLLLLLNNIYYLKKLLT